MSYHLWSLRRLTSHCLMNVVVLAYFPILRLIPAFVSPFNSTSIWTPSSRASTFIPLLLQKLFCLGWSFHPNFSPINFRAVYPDPWKNVQSPFASSILMTRKSLGCNLCIHNHEFPPNYVHHIMLSCAPSPNDAKKAHAVIEEFANSGSGYDPRLIQSLNRGLLPAAAWPSTEVGAFYWTDLAPGIVNSGREEQGLVSV